jgi:hypothetical protein
MKIKNVVLFALPILLAISACQKEDRYWPLSQNWKGSQLYGKVGAFRNGEFWEASGEAKRYPGSEFLGISVSAYRPQSSVFVEGFGFGKVPYKVGRYDMIKTSFQVVNYPGWSDSLSSYYALGYDDVIGSFYSPDTTAHNWIEIESIDSISGLIRGRFDMTYVLDPKYHKSKYLKKVHFGLGLFELKKIE